MQGIGFILIILIILVALDLPVNGVESALQSVEIVKFWRATAVAPGFVGLTGAFHPASCR